MRSEDIVFAEAMEKKLKANDHKGGWESCSKEKKVRNCKGRGSYKK